MEILLYHNVLNERRWQERGYCVSQSPSSVSSSALAQVLRQVWLSLEVAPTSAVLHQVCGLAQNGSSPSLTARIAWVLREHKELSCREKSILMRLEARVPHASLLQRTASRPSLGQ